MKIYNWIDSFFDTRLKRRGFLLGLVSLFWIWQGIWQILFFLSLNQISDYASLFDFMERMKGFSASYLVGFVYALIGQGSMSLDHVWNAFTNVLQGNGGVWILISLIGLLCLSKSKKRTILFSFVLWLGILFMILAFAMQSQSIEQLIQYLYIVSWVGLLGSLGLVLFLLMSFVQKIIKLYKK